MGLSNAPVISTQNGFSVSNLDYLVMPYDALGSIPVFEAVKRGIDVFAVKENLTALNVTPDKISNSIITVSDYDACLDYIVKKC